MLNLVKTNVSPLKPVQGLVSLIAGLWSRQPAANRRFNAAVRAAFRGIASEHWRNTESLFDEYFLATHAQPLLQAIPTEQRWPTPEELALIWYSQFGDSGQTGALTKRVGAIRTAKAFLTALRSEWHSGDYV